MLSLFKNAHLPASTHFDTISAKGSSAEHFLFLPLLVSQLLFHLQKQRRSAFISEKKKAMVALHFSFYVKDYSNSVSFFFFSQSTEGRVFLPRRPLIFHSLCRSRGAAVGRIAAV